MTFSHILISILGLLVATMLIVGGMHAKSLPALGCIVLIAVMAVGAFFALRQAVPDEPAKPETRTYPLRALTTGEETQGAGGGSIFLATGYVHEEPVYRFYREIGPGRFDMETLNSDDVVIVEDGKREVRYMDENILGYYDTVELHVPVGSIAPSLDLTLPN